MLQPAESEGERDAAAEKDPGHVAIGEEGNSNADAEGTQQSAQLAAQDSEASSAVQQCLRPCMPATRQCTRLLVSGARTSWSCLRSSFSESSRGLPQAFLSAFLSAGS